MEKRLNDETDTKELKEKVAYEIKMKLGVKPKEIIILEEGTLPRATHKAKRLQDLRQKA